MQQQLPHAARRTTASVACLQRRHFRLCAVAALLLAALLSGCATNPFRADSRKPGIWERMQRSIGMARETPLEMGRKFSPQEQREVQLCRQAYERRDYDKAIELCKVAAKKFKESSLGEEAQFYLAESWYAKQRYSKAQDAYDQLFEDYPSTKYVEPVTRRLYSIAQAWLQTSEPGAKEGIRTVSAEKVISSQPENKPSDPTLRVRILPNFHDRSRPVFDTQGRALQCLKSIWMNDPTGPLADDSLMLTAAWHQRHSNHVEADRYFGILRDEYPDSPHLEAAFVLGAHAKQMSYQGAFYEGEDLVGARRLKEQSLQLFPASHQRQQLRKDLDILYRQEAERQWAMVDYYRRKQRPRAIAIACVRLISEYPDTGFARDARILLAEIDRSELKDLPEVLQFMEALPRNAPAPVPAQNDGDPVKSVSQPGGTDNETSGKARL
ncbi:MAG: tetratricopeptide repeat protein [Planctomyces sp.]|jgi:outer membrane protein assembly factor BamD (BamD/ComL family)